jgi:hypothetical protein
MFDSGSVAEERGDAGDRPLVIGVLALLSLVALVIAIITTFAAGVTWDDGIELYALRAELAVLHNGAPDYATAAAGILDLHAWYGFVADAVAHLIAWLLGIDPAWDVSFTAASYVVRHFVALGFGLLCVIVLAATLWRLTRRPVAAAALPALLLCLPTFGGHAAMNIKDIPVACGLTLIACGFALALHGLRLGRSGVATFAVIGVGTFIAVGTRGGSIALVAVIAGATGLGAFAMYRRRALTLMVWSGVAILLGVAGVVATNPVAPYAPLAWLVQCVRLASAWPAFNPPQLVAGQIVYPQSEPWWYVPVWLAVQTPLAFAALALCSVHRSGRDGIVWLPFVVLGLFIPILIIVAGSTLFNALRHLLFIQPALALAATLGADRLAARRPWLATALVALVVAECALWVPYQYAYVNQIGIALGGASAFEGDYWGIAGREAARRLHEAGAERAIVGPGPTGYPYGAGTEYGDVPEFDGYYAFSYGGRIALVDFPIPAGACRRQFVITRMGMRLGEGFVCTPPVTAHPPEWKK